MSDFAKIVVKQLKPDYIARCLLESCDKSSYDKYVEDKLLYGLRCKDVDFYKKIIRSQFKQIRSAEKAYRTDNNGQMKFTSDHHYHFILARHVIRPLLYHEVGVYLKIYKDLGMFGSGYSKSTQTVYTKPAEPVYVKPAEPVYTKPAEPVYVKPAEAVYVKPVEPVYVKPAEPSLIIEKEIEKMFSNMLLDNKPVVVISTAPKPVVFNLYCVV
jgi:hypothetical protein